MATAPFNIDDTVPASSDLVSQYPAPAREFRDVVASWLQVDHNNDPGGHKWITLDTRTTAPANPPAGNERLYNVGTRLYLRGSGGAFTRILTGSVAAFNTEAFVSEDLTGAPNLASLPALTGVGALNSGSITSGFGNINIGSSIFTGNGSGLTALNASNLASGTVPDARMATHAQGTWNAGSNTTERVISPAKLAGAVAAMAPSPDLSNLNASNLTSGTVPSARMSGTYNNITGIGTISSGSISSGFGNINIGSSSITAGAISGSTGTFSSTVSFGSVLARTTAGTMTIRPSGAGSTAGQMTYTTAGNLVAAGNITANSDERLKTDWSDLADDVIERVATLRSGTYTRLDSGLRQVGVGAQSLQAILPDAVIEQEESGHLAVAYGQAALALVVELAKRIVALEEVVHGTSR